MKKNKKRSKALCDFLDTFPLLEKSEVPALRLAFYAGWDARKKNEKTMKKKLDSPAKPAKVKHKQISAPPISQGLTLRQKSAPRGE